MKAEIQAKLDELKAYSIEQGEYEESAITSLFSPVYSRLNNYYGYDGDLNTAFNRLIPMHVNDLTERFTIWEKNEEYGVSFNMNFPAGYNDYADLFGSMFEQIPTVSNETFYGAFVEVTDESTTTLTNSYLSSWSLGEEEEPDSHNGEVAALNTLYNFCDSTTSTMGFVNTFENRGTILSSLSKEQVSDKIYLDRHLKDIIEDFNLNVYLPMKYR